jgi:hypothetical protein
MLVVPVKVGDVDSTLLPVPVLATLITFLLASNARAVEAVKPDKVVVPDTTRFVAELDPPVLLTFIKSDPFHATWATSPATMVTPVVGPTPTILMDCVLLVLLITV